MPVEPSFTLLAHMGSQGPAHIGRQGPGAGSLMVESKWHIYITTMAN